MCLHLPRTLRLELVKEILDIIEARRLRAGEPSIGLDVETYLLERELRMIQERTWKAED
jgi:hypothetical protein